MAFSQNILQQVQRFMQAGLLRMQNSNVLVKYGNKKFENFQETEGNLGDTVSFQLTTRATVANGLVAVDQPIEQRRESLTVNKAVNVSFEMTGQERIFNLDQEGYMKEIGAAAAAELGSAIEKDVALNAISAVIDDREGSPTYGQPNYRSGAYRFFGDGITAIDSFTKLAKMIANFKNFSAVKSGIKVILPDTIIPDIVGSGLNQFVPRRNDDMAESWEVGEFGTPPVSYYQSNLLPIHYSGTVGESRRTLSPIDLTVVSTNDPTGANITQITFSGATANDVDAIKYGDVFQFNDIAGDPTKNLRFLTFVGHSPSAQPVQFRAIADAGANGSGQVVVNIFPALSSVSGRNQNLNKNIVAGMTCKVAPSHRAGVIMSGNADFLAMPKLPDQEPFASAAAYDDETGVSMRLSYGSLLGQNQKRLIHDCIWGSFWIPEYCGRILIPLE